VSPAAATLRPSLREHRALDEDGSRLRPALITGGAGFVGTNLADRLLSEGRPVILFDNLSRPGVHRNVLWLRRRHGDRARLMLADVRDGAALAGVLADVDHVYHFAAQVAVTTSLMAPAEDFEVNARGTLNLLEALRALPWPPSLVFTSTNKVYGDLSGLELRLERGRYQPADPAVHRHGIAEAQVLQFRSPYGCSKGTADQYVLDYARSFGLPAVVFRMSCVYGPHQFGTEDQGWVAHFLIRAMLDRPITVYGDGMQVRDVLFVDDLVEAMLGAQRHMERIAGQAFNIGGGPEQAVTLLELLELIGQLRGRQPPLTRGAWRTGDQRYYVSDIRHFQGHTGWSPRVRIAEGVDRLHRWLQEEMANGGSGRALDARGPVPAGVRIADALPSAGSRAEARRGRA
jgi:CDP-paratose 2-epimerase